MHLTAASVNARFVAVPTLEFDFTGVQDAAPLTALHRQDASVVLTSGLDFGPGAAPSETNNVGNEFNVAGFSTGSTLQSAIDGDDYLTFAVRAIPGLAMFPDSVSFTLWRQAGTSATDYAVLSSVDGFSSGAELTQAHLTTAGSANQQVITGAFADADPTTDPVEFRLYGWNAATELDSTHLVGASMRARFASVAGSPLDPTGSLTVQGDLYHLAGGMIDIDLGGDTAGVDYDTINVLGNVELEGDLAVSLADAGGSPFAPTLGDTFNILTATQGITGQFANVSLPQLTSDLAWRVDYLSTAVRLDVLLSADFNQDGAVDVADYVLWRNNNGNEADYLNWRSHFGMTVSIGSGASDFANGAAVPEPASLCLLLIGMSVFSVWHRRTTRCE